MLDPSGLARGKKPRGVGGGGGGAGGAGGAGGVGAGEGGGGEKKRNFSFFFKDISHC